MKTGCPVESTLRWKTTNTRNQEKPAHPSPQFTEQTARYPGLLESIYEKREIRELQLRGTSAIGKERVELRYKDSVFAENVKFDLLVENCLLIELKAVEKMGPIWPAFKKLIH